MSQSKSAPIYSLTSLRFFAAAMIVAGHGSSPWFFKDFAITSFDVRPAVSFFFVLSGFILSYTYAKKLQEIRLKDFIIARLARLWPIHFLCALLSVFILGDWNQLDSGQGWVKLCANVLLLHSLIPFSDWFFSFNSVSWSISTELAFYAMFPFLFRGLHDFRNLLIFGISAWILFYLTVSAVIGVDASERSTSITVWGLFYISPLSRVLEFLAGIICFQIFDQNRGKSHSWPTIREITAIAVLICAVFLTTKVGRSANIPSSIRIWLLTCGAFVAHGILITIFAREEGLLSRVLKTKILVVAGELSFSLYMVHQIVLRGGVKYLSAAAAQNPTLAYITYWIVSIFLSFVLFSLVEKPSRRFLVQKFI